MSRSWAAWCALALAVAPLALAASVASPYVESDGVEYYMVAGELGSSTLSIGPFPDAATLPFDGCAFAQLRPESERGRMQVVGLVGDPALGPQSYLEIDFERFSGPLAMQGGLALNLTVDGALDHGVPQHPPVFADAAGWGTAFLSVNGVALGDPVGDGETLQASFLQTRQGYRDDASGEFRTPAADAEEDTEMQIRIESPAGAVPTTHRFTFAAPTDLGERMSPNAAHTFLRSFNNTKYGGTATVQVVARADAAPGLNEIHLSLHAPDGAELANHTFTPSVLGSQSEEFAFPLDQFGAYYVQANGKVALANYTIAVTLAPPPHFDLQFSWESVSVGMAARLHHSECQQTVGAPNGVVPAATTVGRAQPPGFPLELVILAVVASATVVLVVAKLTSDSLGAGGLGKKRP